ncbi:Pkr1-domain-containing protein [Massarina eburnea CBS 473.64]|uniref:Pkr1-domain-containing protein n=1 Tax=Massarina eburnea CBS 473.64 TaxID=1395130 RepID=A0A6A6S4Y3_9PLEO|nr:Pkr1-domain-containing protein [Massarina eburnea CBS 473.64]
MAAVATFLENLFNSIFTPGPTPTLLVATNATFAALQALFFALLLATYSIHFIILSALTAGLWWAINWFAAEIREAQAKEEAAKRIRDAKKGRGGRGRGEEEGEDGDAEGEGDDTEVETEVDVKQRQKEREQSATLKPGPKPRAPKQEMQSTVFVERPSEDEYPGPGRGREATPVQSSLGPASASTTGANTKLAPVDDSGRKRRSMGESTGELSTDSEWEKLSQDSNDK